jgi:hypothetical protein
MTELLLLCALREEDLQLIAARRALLAASNRSEMGTVFSSEAARMEPYAAVGGAASTGGTIAEGRLMTTSTS